MTKRTIAIDIDDVLADSTESLRKLVNDRTGSELTSRQYRVPGEYWGYYERVWSAHGLEELKLADFEKEMAIDQSHMPLLPGAAFAVHELSKRFHIIIITARDVSWEAATRQWFREHFAKDDLELYFAGHNKSEGHRTKGETCRELNASLLIDDNPAHCQSALDQGVDAILFGQYGWHVKTPASAVQCKDWPAVVEYLNAKI